MRGTLNVCVLILNCTLICIFFKEGGAAGPRVTIDGFGEVWSRVSDLDFPVSGLIRAVIIYVFNCATLFSNCI